MNLFSRNSGISRVASIAIVVIVVVIIVVGGFLALNLGGTSTTLPSTQTSTQTTNTQTTTSTSHVTSVTSTSTSSTSQAPSILTWETVNTPQYLDPHVATDSYDLNILQNVYEPLLWYNGTSSTDVIPWLASSYTLSADGKTANFTLRPGISFADGEPFNSTAVYFTLNRLLIIDGSSPTSHGPGQDWIIQQLENQSLSVQLGGPHNYTAQWANEVLAQNFIQITGPLTFMMHIQNPNDAFPYLLAGQWATMLAPVYVMQHDVALWNASGSGYTLPYPTLSGNETTMIHQYFMDEIATCNTGPTPNGCGTTYLDGSASGSLAGTGPYTISSVNPTTNDIVLKANTNYWGGPLYTKISPKISTIDINYVPQVSTRELDLQNAAKSGQAMTVDIPSDHLYDVANRNAWITNGTLEPIVPGVNLYGPFTTYATLFDPFATNVTNPQTGTLYAFQPFADYRLRLAFADAVNMSNINDYTNNRMGQVAINAIPPGLPPAGSYNSSITPVYSYNLTAVQNLLLDAMLHPLTHFTFVNGTAAPAGIFNNTFGCTTLNSNGQCSKPVIQTISLVYPTGDSVDQQIMNSIASAINNVSSTYNMGLSVQIVPVPFGQMLTELFQHSVYFYSLAWYADYPWVTDFTSNIFAPGGAYPGLNNWNISQMQVLNDQALQASASRNYSELVRVTNQMNVLANDMVLYLWTFYPAQAWTNSAVAAFTSNIQGYYYNPSTNGMYFATMY